MKLLLDENLSHRLATALSDLYPGSLHVRDCGMRGASDLDVWQYALANEFVIVSKDSDFAQRSSLLGSPPKVIWVRIGNCTTTRRFCTAKRCSPHSGLRLPCRGKLPGSRQSSRRSKVGFLGLRLQRVMQCTTFTRSAGDGWGREYEQSWRRDHPGA